MDIKTIVYVLGLIAVFGTFTYKSYRKLPLEYDNKLIRRVYYIFSVSNIFLFVMLYYNNIASLNIVKIENVDIKLINYILVITTLFVLSVLWEYLFVSCRTFKNFKFKDLEVSIDEIDKIKYVDKFQEKQIDALYLVLNANIKMQKYIDYYISSHDLDLDTAYTDVIQEYQNKRKGVSLAIFKNSPIGLKMMHKQFKLSPQQLSAIMYSVNLNGFCAPNNFKTQNYIFAEIKTKYISDDLIIVLKGDLLIDKEYLVIIDIVNYFEIKIALEITKL